MKLKIALLSILLAMAYVYKVMAQSAIHEAAGTPTYATELHVLTTVIGNVALIVDTISGATGDLASFRNNGTAKVKIGPSGHLFLPQYTKTQIDTLVPDHGVGDLVVETNGTLANQVCIATGTLVSQWRALQGASTLGCGTNN